MMGEQKGSKGESKGQPARTAKIHKQVPSDASSQKRQPNIYAVYTSGKAGLVSVA